MPAPSPSTPPIVSSPTRPSPTRAEGTLPIKVSASMVGARCKSSRIAVCPRQAHRHVIIGAQTAMMADHGASELIGRAAGAQPGPLLGEHRVAPLLGVGAYPHPHAAIRRLYHRLGA